MYINSIISRYVALATPLHKSTKYNNKSTTSEQFNLQLIQVAVSNVFEPGTWIANFKFHLTKFRRCSLSISPGRETIG